MHRVHDSLKAIVCAKLFIDVVEMIAQGLEANFFVMGNLHSLVAPPEQLENTPFFVGERRSRCWSPEIGIVGVGCHSLDLFEYQEHVVYQFFLFLYFCNITSEVRYQPLMSLRILEQ